MDCTKKYFKLPLIYRLYPSMLLLLVVELPYLVVEYAQFAY